MPKQSNNATPYSREFRRQLKKRYHLNDMESANSLANELYKREMMRKTEEAIKTQKTDTPTIDTSVNAETSILPNASKNKRGQRSKLGVNNVTPSIFDRAEIVDIQLDDGVTLDAVDMNSLEQAGIDTSTLRKEED